MGSSGSSYSVGPGKPHHLALVEAELAGVGKNTVNRLERNRTEPHMTTIRKLAEALGVEPAELVRGG